MIIASFNNNELIFIVWQQVVNLLNKRTFKQGKHC